MRSDPLETLVHPFEAGAVEAPGPGERFLFLGAEPGFRLPRGFSASLKLVQGFRPWYLRLQAAGHEVVPCPEGSGLDGAIILCGRHRGQNEARLAEAIDRVKSGGLILMAGSTADGAPSLRRRIEALLPLEGYLPKHHGVAFWLRRPGGPEAEAAASLLRQRPALVDGRFVTAPGMFSHERIDPGSCLLSENLPDFCRGAAADFGAGWGYLAASLAERTAGLETIDLYEADFASLEAAKRNLERREGRPDAGFYWRDLATEAVERKYDLVVMNPPFHHGRAAEPGIGQAMIRAASSALRRGGRLLMVHNRGLPYDTVLRGGFSEVSEMARDAAFRVVAALR